MQSFFTMHFFFLFLMHRLVRFLKWSFGTSMEKKDLRFGYIMKVMFTNASDSSGDARLEWDYVGNKCSGAYISATSIAALNFLQKRSTVLLTYRILDSDSLLIVIVYLSRFMHLFMFFCCCHSNVRHCSRSRNW